MNPQHSTFTQLIASVRRRLRTQWTLRGIAITLAITAAAVIAASLLAPALHHGKIAMFALRAGSFLLALAALFLFLVRPLRKKVQDLQVARLVEQNYILSDRLVSVIEFSEDDKGASQALLNRLAVDTSERCTRVDPDRVVDIRKSWGYAAGAAMVPIVVGLLILFGPASLSGELSNMLMPFGGSASANTMFISVAPGDALVPKGLDEKIRASLHGFESDTSEIFIRKKGETEWIGSPMEPAKKDGDFQFVIFNIQDSVSYYIVSHDIKSPEFSLNVGNLPLVKQLDLNLFFPSYTHLQTQKIENGGEVSALKGTLVKLDSYLNGEAQSARLVMNDGSTVDLTASGPNHFSGQFAVKADGTYHIEVTSKEGQRYNATTEYDISALNDHPPTVVIDKPGRDTKVTSVEEVFTQVKAEDDYGVGSIDLVYSVNGSEERTVSLQGPKSGSPTHLTGTHTFFLEELGLKPGDFISYYARARDNNAVTGPQQAMSDIYFLEVRPFDRKFKQGQQSGGGGQGGDDSDMLANREREIIAATFRVQREDANYTPEDRDQNYDTVRLSQEKLKTDTDALVDRIKRRMGDQLNSDQKFGEMTKNLANASNEMATAIGQLGSRKAKDAMLPEQKALDNLIKAQGIFREIQVTQNNGGGGQNQNPNQDLADLFELQLDKMKNQYESVQRQQTAEQNEKQDELNRRLKELAERMQKQLEQQMRSQMEGQGGGGGSPRNMQQTAQDAEKMARELEKLSRDQRDPMMEQAAEQLRQAAQQMRSTSETQSQAGRSQALAAQLRAMSLMQQAQRLMNQAQRQNGQQGVSGLRQRAEEVLRKQSDIEKSEDQISKQSPSATGAGRQQLSEKKDELAESVTGLASDIEQAARQSGQSGQTNNSLHSAADSIRRNNLPDRIRDSGSMVQAGKMDQAKAADRGIKSEMQNVLRNLQAAENSAGKGPQDQGKGQAQGQGLEDALSKARELEEGIDSLLRKAQAGQQSGQQNGQQSQNGSQSGNQAGQQQGQNGQQQGQQSSAGKQTGGRQNSSGQQKGQSGQQQSGQQAGRQSGQKGQQQGQQNAQQNGQQAGEQSGQQNSQQNGQQGQQANGRRNGQSRSSSNNGSRQGSQGPPGPQSGQSGAADTNAGGMPSPSSGQLESGGDPLSVSPEQMRSELKQRISELEQLKKSLEQNGLPGKDTDNIMQRLKSVNPNSLMDPNQLAMLKNDVLSPLRQLELELARRLQDQLGSGMAGALGEGAAPERYKKMIEDYYKRLSERASPQQP